MSGRAIDVTTDVLLGASHVQVVTLVEMQFTSQTMYVAGAAADIVWNSINWQAIHGLLTIDDMEETSAEVKGIALTLSGVPPDKISLGLSENVYGRPIIIRNLVITEGGALFIDPSVWVGVMDTMTIQDTPTTATVRVTAEHRMAIWNRPRLVRFSTEDQRLIDRDDKFFDYTASLSQEPIVWPGREYFLR